MNITTTTFAASIGDEHVVFPQGPQASNTPSIGNMPPSIAEDQLYYWTARWQREEQETLQELAHGEGHRFESAADAVRWLLDPSKD